MKKIAKILGSGGAIPTSGKAASSEMVFIENSQFVLIDAGFGIAQAISTSGEAYENLNSIFITHYHADHVCDLPTILFSYFLSTKKKSIKIYVPKENQSFIPNLFFDVFGHLPKTIEMVNGFIPTLELVPFTGETTMISSVKVSSFPMKHGNMETFGLVFDNGSVRLGISSDTTYCDSLIEIANNCDILIQDCAFSDDFGPNPIHAIPNQINTLIKDTVIRKVFINHLMPETIGKEENILKAITKNISIKVEIALDGKILNYGD
jgi:ribonuclease BN (tRNA processing enzyme)